MVINNENTPTGFMQLTTPHVLSGVIEISPTTAPLRVGLPGGTAWGLRARFSITGNPAQTATIEGLNSPLDDFDRPLQAGQITLNPTEAAQELQLELREGPPRGWVAL